MDNLQFGLSSDIIKQLQSVFAGHPHIERVDIFGSRARGDYKPSSDIDLAVYGTKDFTFQDYLSVMEKIDNLPIIFKVDVVDVNSINKPELIETIKRDGKLFWERVKA